MRRFLSDFRAATAVLLAAVFLLMVTAGCHSTPKSRAMTPDDMVPTLFVLSPGDAIELTFMSPSATNFSGVHRINPEGTVTLPLVGQVAAAGKTAPDLQTELLGLYKKELQDPELIVGIAGSANQVYVSGAVLRPGRVSLDRPLTALEAVMESGGFADNADRKKVQVVRYVGDENQTWTINLDVLSGDPVPPFYLRAKDILHVPAKFQWF
jgi:polysaccharide export outer membrane protein